MRAGSKAEGCVATEHYFGAKWAKEARRKVARFHRPQRLKPPEWRCFFRSAKALRHPKAEVVTGGKEEAFKVQSFKVSEFQRFQGSKFHRPQRLKPLE